MFIVPTFFASRLEKVCRSSEKLKTSNTGHGTMEVGVGLSVRREGWRSKRMKEG
jgi:hypothetical protein